MALQLPAIGFLRGYEPKDIVEQFAKGYGFGEGIRNENEADDALSAWIDSLTGGGARKPSATDTLVRGSADAAEAARDPMLSAYFDNTRRAESGGDDTARNPNSTATGRYQFLEGTWNDLATRHPDLGLTPDGRLDPAQQERAMRVFTQENAKALRGSGVPINPGTLYAAHFLGPGGAAKVLSADPNASVASMLDPSVVKANPQLGQMTVAQFQQWASEKGGNGEGGYAPPASETTTAASTRIAPEVLKRLVRNPVTREFGVQLAQGKGSGQQWQQFTGTDGKMYQVDTLTGKVDAVGGGGVTVNTGDNSGAFRKKSDELAAERMGSIVEAGASAQTFMGDLEALADLGRNLNTGKTAEVLNALGPYAEAFGIDIAGLGEGQAYDAIVSRMAPQMRVPGSGASSDFDARQFLKSLPGLGKSPEGNALIIETFQAVQEHKIKAAEIASRAQRDEITWQEADAQIRALGDPFSAFKKAKKGGLKAPADQQPVQAEAYPEGTVIENDAGERMVMRGGEWVPE